MYFCDLSRVAVLQLVAVTWFLYVSKVDARPRIVGLTEDVVSRVGSSAVLNCTVSSPPNTRYYAEWVFLRGPSQEIVLSRDCRIFKPASRNLINGREKHQIFCQTDKDGNEIYSLKANMLSIPDNGQYECRVSLIGAQVEVSMIVNLTVLAPPKMGFSESTLIKNAFIGDDVRLQCFADGVPSPNVTWGSANGKPLPPNNRSVSTQLLRTNTQTKQELLIKNVTKEDRGTYRCSADNNIRPPDDLYAQLAIEFAPTVLPVEPSYGTATGETSKAMLWCQVDGDPRPTMSWYALSPEQSDAIRKGQLTPSKENFANFKNIITDSKYKVEQKIMTVGSLSTMESMFYSLTIFSVEAIDLVYYVCQAENTHGEQWALVELYQVNALVSGRNSAETHSPIVPIVLLPVALLAALSVL